MFKATGTKYISHKNCACTPGGGDTNLYQHGSHPCTMASIPPAYMFYSSWVGLLRVKAATLLQRKHFWLLAQLLPYQSAKSAPSLYFFPFQMPGFQPHGLLEPDQFNFTTLIFTVWQDSSVALSVSIILQMLYVSVYTWRGGTRQISVKGEAQLLAIPMLTRALSPEFAWTCAQSPSLWVLFATRRTPSALPQNTGCLGPRTCSLVSSALSFLPPGECLFLILQVAQWSSPACPSRPSRY